MTGQQIILEGAKHLGLINSTRDAVLADKVFNEDDLLQYLRYAYSKAYVRFKRKFPDRCIQRSYGHNWESLSTASASSTGYTLVVGDSIFDQGCIGCIVYNSTDSEFARIISVTNSTTVTIDANIADSWDGDQIYLLTGRIPFVGDLSDVQDVKFLGMKFDTTDLDYTPVAQSSNTEVHELNISNQSGLTSSNACWFLAPLTPADDGDEDASNDSGLIQGMQVLPLPEKNISNGYYLEYTTDPNLIGLTTSPVFSRDNHFFLSYGIAAASGKGYGLSKEDIKDFWDEYNKGLMDLLDSSESNRGITFKPSKKISHYSRLRRR